ncbi:DUF1178 family protein [Arenicella xantha]|uniref:Uncharacterized protein n=1 Tax=Arenicella xantha TaxID=644221 RepID=A0A395JIB5_9GAMM|nr:DUF1178 family protein [Arenicella xantha]RBP48484.1 hypothetical protein DFR28_10786 [Arenicella xantha]
MVIYDLICDSSHTFEGWFKDASDFESQQSSSMILCPFCDSELVTKKLAAPKLSRKSNSVPQQQQVATGDRTAEAFAQLQDMLGRVHTFIEKNFEDVGNRFAEEALSIHRGEREDENIRGTASVEELKQLAEEGVTSMTLPPKPINKKKLN